MTAFSIKLSSEPSKIVHFCEHKTKKDENCSLLIQSVTFDIKITGMIICKSVCILYCRSLGRPKLK